MKIQRDRYLNQIIAKKNDGMIKIITGIRRCGKSYLLNVLFRQHLMDTGVAEQNIVMLALDEDINAKYRNPLELGKYIREICANKEGSFYVLLDEIQKVDSIQNPYLPGNPNEKIGFVDVLLGLKKLDNVDFVSKAPVDVVELQREKKRELLEKREATASERLGLSDLFSQVAADRTPSAEPAALWPLSCWLRSLPALYLACRRTSGT